MKKSLTLIYGFILLPLYQFGQDSLFSGTDFYFPSQVVESSDEWNEDALAGQNEHISYFRKHPIDLNKDDLDDLASLMILTPLQLDALKLYKKNIGPLISEYEMQSVPGWDVQLINKIKPYVTVNLPANPNSLSIFRSPKVHQIIIRTTQMLEKTKGFSSWDELHQQFVYPGSVTGLLLKYNFKSGNHFGFSVSGEKDPGEPLFRNIKSGFDFLTANLWIKDLNSIKLLVLGDYAVNIGQGLISWQGFSFGGSFDPALFKKSSPVINRFRSTAEFGFNRGAAISLSNKNWEHHCWFSKRNLDARLVINEADSSIAEISSFLTTGLHRTTAEISRKNNTKLYQAGYAIQWHHSNFNAGFNFQYVALDNKLTGGKELYEHFRYSGKQMSNLSFDAGFNLFNIHWFGELAFDEEYRFATIIGAIGSLSRYADLAFSYRHVPLTFHSPSLMGLNQYYSINATNSFSSLLNTQLAKGYKLSFCLEQTKNPWPGYSKNSTSLIRSWSIRFLVEKNKRKSLVINFRKNNEQENVQDDHHIIKPICAVVKNQLDIQQHLIISEKCSLINQLNIVGFRKEGLETEEGFSLGCLFQYKTKRRGIKSQLTFRYFNTDEFASGIYFREATVNSTTSNVLVYGKGCRIAALINYDLSKSIVFDFKLTFVEYYGKDDIGQGWDEVLGNQRAFVYAQVKINL